MTRVALFISGGGSNMLSLVESMTGDHPARPCLVLSNRADAGGLAKAEALGIATEVVDHRPHKGDRAAFETELQSVLMRHSPDLICLAGFMRVLTEGFTSQWEGRMLNIHPSLLPKYKGLHTHQRALDAGDTEAGCTVHEVTAKLDDGPILGQARVPVEADDTAETLAARVLAQEHILYPAVLKRFVSGDKTPLYLP
ncbi:phosphoribosylglycinamide formyltransferase [Lentibacter sp. XHP0401]|uniref:phosphoribosylglycinamide formyltransferase n=1 Tax=Lentibacter sp. XHP0401 TaxID=2984334 RepID=UPI0021E746D0|nr:phosphoribosylglycinamide formyltransferase [Lentibacter sp. XHP0401]MCV2892185.1 phosphoribosylglycinamide formyltransferase [Lentibacter sp. XHP0401]